MLLYYKVCYNITGNGSGEQNAAINDMKKYVEDFFVCYEDYYSVVKYIVEEDHFIPLFDDTFTYRHIIVLIKKVEEQMKSNHPGAAEPQQQYAPACINGSRLDEFNKELDMFCPDFPRQTTYFHIEVYGAGKKMPAYYSVLNINPADDNYENFIMSYKNFIEDFSLLDNEMCTAFLQDLTYESVSLKQAISGYFRNNIIDFSGINNETGDQMKIIEIYRKKIDNFQNKVLKGWLQRVFNSFIDTLK